MEQLTAKDVLSLIGRRAQWCREEGESDMRNILNTIRSIGSQINEGKSREEILEYYTEEE